MKKIAYYLSIMFFLAAFAPAAMANDNKPAIDKTLTVEQQAKLSEIEGRVAEIKAMDFSEMTAEERKEVKNELREMKKEAKRVGGGVYISVGAIILILILILIFA